jgi:hypothetical protein
LCTLPARDFDADGSERPRSCNSAAVPLIRGDTKVERLEKRQKSMVFAFGNPTLAQNARVGHPASGASKVVLCISQRCLGHPPAQIFSEVFDSTGALLRVVWLPVILGAIMSNPPQLSGPSQELRELMQFLREENAAFRSGTREEIEATRSLLTHSIKIVSYPVAVAIAIFGLLLAFISWMGLKSFQDLKKSISTQAEQTTRSEVGRMQNEVRDRLTQEFQRESIQRTIRAAARDATTTEARPLIKSEVSRQVHGAVATEQAAVRKIATEQLENEFYWIRNFSVVSTINLSPPVGDVGTFTEFVPTVNLHSKSLTFSPSPDIAEFSLQRDATNMVMPNGSVVCAGGWGAVC